MSESTKKKTGQWLLIFGLIAANVVYLGYSPLFPG